MIVQLNPPIPVFVPGRGNGLAHAVIDYGPEYHLVWVIFMDDGGEIWCLPNPFVRGQTNVTMGRVKSFEESAMAWKLPQFEEMKHPRGGQGKFTFKPDHTRDTKKKKITKRSPKRQAAIASPAKKRLAAMKPIK